MVEIKNRYTNDVIFKYAGDDLSGANLSEANLSDANLCWANLSEADLSGADLHGANLHGANLHGANLSEANLSEANLSDANLSEANLSGANLSGANLPTTDVIMSCPWSICHIRADYIQIGCQRHDVEKWSDLSDAQINDMADNALEWWKRNKEIVLFIASKLASVK